MSTKPIRCLLIGHYGYGNFGDDLFVKAFSEIASYRQDLELFVLSTPIAGVDAKFIVPAAITPTLYSSSSVKGRLIRLWYAVSAASRCDAIVWCGGSQFDRSKQGLAKLVVRFIAGARGVRRLACGISVSPRDLESSVSRWFFKGMNRIAVRDEPSLVALEEMAKVGLNSPVRYGGDLAAVFQPQKISNVPRDYISLVIGDCPTVTPEMIEILSLSTAQIASEEGLDIKIICLNHGTHGGDLLVSKMSLEHLKKSFQGEVSLVTPAELLSKWELLAGSKYVVSMRLHGAVCSYFDQIKFVLIEYNKKCTDFLDDIELPHNERVAWPLSGVEGTVLALRNALNGAGAQKAIDTYRENSQEVFQWVLEGVEKRT